MRQTLVPHLRCPVHMLPLSCVIENEMDDGHVMVGKLICPESCEYKIQDGIPNLTPQDDAIVEGDNLKQLQDATIERFGYEWRFFEDWGWLTEYPDIPDAEEKFYGGLLENTRSAFWGKSLLNTEYFSEDSLVLDAGCGNGRFCGIASETGAEIIGIDLGHGVVSAFQNTRHMPNVHIVQGDLFRLPFAKQTFDIAYSIGVLMHTGNAEEAFASVANCVKLDGLFGIRVYGQGRKAYELLDKFIRDILTKLPISGQMIFSKAMARLARRLRKNEQRYQKIYSYINLLPTDHHMFDWWSAPIATHHTVAEVARWYQDSHFDLQQIKPALENKKAQIIRKKHHAPITALGQKRLSEG
jgi:SAM-dependent methyltransferase/uncharacterized protein YbaR (Trm112 family)